MSSVAFLRSISVFVFTCVLIAPVVGQVSEPQTASEHFDVGLLHLHEQRFSEALEALRQSAKLSPDQPETHGNIGSALLGLGRPAEAAAAFREAIRLAPRDGSFHTALCGALIAMSSPNEAAVACETGVKLNPDSPDAHGLYSDALRFAGRPQSDVQRAIDSALARFPENDQIVLAAAEHYSTGNPSYSAELFEKLIRIDPSARNHARLAEIYLRLEREPEAVAAAREALEIEPDNPFANYFMGKLFFELGLHEEAAAAFEKVIASGVPMPSAPHYLAVSEARRGRVNEAINILKTAIADSPDDFDLQCELGRLLNRQSRYDEAIASFRKAINIDPKHFEAKIGLGIALLESARFEQAIPVLEEANRMRPGNEAVAMLLRVTRGRQEHLPRIEAMKRFAREHPDDLRIRADLVTMLSFTRRLTEAEPFIEEFWALRPTDIKMIQSIAVAYSTAGAEDKAMETYRRSLTVKESPDAYLGLAGILSKRGQADEASRAFAKVIELKPDVPNIMKIYADHLRDNGKRREALEMYRRSLAILPMNGPALSNAGILSAKLGEIEAARSYLESLRTADPDSAKTLERCLRLLIQK